MPAPRCPARVARAARVSNGGEGFGHHDGDGFMGGDETAAPQDGATDPQG